MGVNVEQEAISLSGSARVRVHRAFRGMGRAAALTMIMRLSSRALAFPTAIVLARAMGPTDYGRYAYALSFSGVLGTVAALGFDRYLVRTVAQHQALGRLSEIRPLIRAAGFAAGAASVLLLALVALAGRLVVPHALWSPTLLALLLVPLFAMTIVRQGALQGLGRVETAFLPEQVVLPTLLLLLLLSAVLAVGNFGAMVAISLNVASAAIAFVVGVILLRRNLSNIANDGPGPSVSLIRGTLPFALIALIEVGQAQLGILVLGAEAEPSTVGAFQVALRLSAVLALVLASINAPLAPALSRLGAEGDIRTMTRLAVRAARVSTIAVVPVAVALILFRVDTMRIFGSGYTSGASALAILVGAQILNAVMGPVAVLLMMTGRMRNATAGFAAALAVNITLTVLLAPAYGASGAAIGQGAGLIAWNVVCWTSVRRGLGVDGSAFGFGRRR